MLRIKQIMVLPVVMALFAFGAVGSVSAQVAVPMVAVQLLSTGLTPNPAPGSTNDTMALIRLDTTYSSDDIRLSSLPLILGVGGGADGSTLTGCVVTNTATGLALSSSNIPTSLATGINTFTLNTPLVLPRGTVTTLGLQCNIASSATLNGVFQFSLNTANVAAVANSTGLPALVTVGVSSPVTVPPIGGGVGFPNTGAGGAATTNMALILGSLLAATVGIAYARKASR